jgi:hypothetical protein
VLCSAQGTGGTVPRPANGVGVNGYFRWGLRNGFVLVGCDEF